MQDPPAPALFDHLPCRLTRAVERPVQVDPDHVVPLLVGHVDHLALKHGCRIVDEDVEATKRTHRFGDHPPVGFRDGDVARHCVSRAFGCTDLLGHLGRSPVVLVDHDHRRSLLGEAEAGRAADAGPPAGDDGDLFLKHHVGRPPSAI